MLNFHEVVCVAFMLVCGFAVSAWCEADDKYDMKQKCDMK